MNNILIMKRKSVNDILKKISLNLRRLTLKRNLSDNILISVIIILNRVLNLI